MKIKTVLISGANGFFGQIACKFFSDLGWKVLRATRNNSDIDFNLEEPKEFARKKTSHKVDAFIHAAAAHEVKCQQYPYESVYQNILGTKSALDFCINNNIDKFIYLSTFHVFGKPEGEINENTSPQPLNDYGLSHLQAEEFVYMYIQKKLINGYVIRPTNFFGIPDDIKQFNRWTLVPYAFCRDAIDKQQISLNTHGYQVRNFISVYDICRVIHELINQTISIPLLHLPGPTSLSVRELAFLVKNTAFKLFKTNIDVITPNIIAPDYHHQKFQYKSLYLTEIFEPEEKIHDFVTDFLNLLNNERKSIETKDL